MTKIDRLKWNLANNGLITPVMEHFVVISRYKLTYFGLLPGFLVFFVLLFFSFFTFRFTQPGNTQSVCVQGISCPNTVGKASCLLVTFMVRG